MYVNDDCACFKIVENNGMYKHNFRYTARMLKQALF